ncbi:ADP-ribosylation factor [Tieghemostelium lacteum]|uniref:ADP-ribosylation factor n=1 Tax=Tieghemostelium lacteum TaxID=361077 RepID=A0A151ZG79_TIELA|nr:ADP-ribosylation factor [Tieghemostelium lacteum]|eukprot:KYQ92982.1 ADP-ribosylation factor [Tieghemostelium lacteum]
MGKAFSKLFKKNKDVRVLMLGLDNAGKSTLLYRIKLKETVQTIPTVGFSVESVKVDDHRYTIWDVGGQVTIRALWRHYYVGTQVVIYVVDSNDLDRLEESKQQLFMVLNDPEMQQAILLVYANKSDLPQSRPVAEITEKMGLDQIVNRKWSIFSCCALTGEGVEQGFAWLNQELFKSNSKRNTTTANGTNNSKNIVPTPVN